MNAAFAGFETCALLSAYGAPRAQQASPRPISKDRDFRHLSLKCAKLQPAIGTQP